MQPLNLIVRFVLELASLLALGVWGYHASVGPLRYLLAPLIPLLVAAVWGTFAVPGDPSRSGRAPIAISGVLRLLLEAAVFGCALWSTWHLGKTTLAGAAALIVVLHYAASYERVAWLLRR